MMQTWAILLDSYRELNHRRLFWIALALSFLVVVAFAIVGINDRGITILHWTLESRAFNTSLVSETAFYKIMFVGLGIKFWLAWIATILALITTAGMIPDLVSSGSIDLMVSKPISRARLLLTKFAGGLLFTALQVTVFTAASFVVIGVRGGSWEPGLFLAIPLVVLFYSYLFSFCALVGLITRSTVASLLLTLLFWMVTALLWGGMVGVNMGRIANRLEIQAIERIMEERTTERGERADLSKLQADLEWQEKARWWWERVGTGFEWTVTFLPKTTATIEVLEKQLIARADLPEAADAGPPQPMFGGQRVRPRVLGQALQEDMKRFTPVWVIGTSVGFQALLLGLGVLIFSRRDY